MIIPRSIKVFGGFIAVVGAIVGIGFLINFLVNRFNKKKSETPDIEKIKSLNNLKNKRIYPGISGDLNLVNCKGKEELTCGVSLYKGGTNPALRRFSIIDLKNDKVVADSVPGYFIKEHTVEPKYLHDTVDDYNKLKENENAKNYKYAAISIVNDDTDATKDKFTGYIYFFNEFKNMDNYVPTLPGILGGGLTHDDIDGTESAKSISDCIEKGKDTYDIVGYRFPEYKGPKCFGYKNLNDGAFPALNGQYDDEIDKIQIACTNGKNIGGSITKTCSV